MGKCSPVCEGCGRVATVQVGRTARRLCRRCAGLQLDGFLQWRSAYRAYRCVVCGEEAVTDVISDEGLERPVCYLHVIPGWRLDLYLAVKGLKTALFSAFSKMLLYRLLVRTLKWANGER